jgi:plasmid stabilization system protein ParE
VGKVDWTEEASRRLRRIYEHIASDDPDAAMRTVRGILSKAQTLARFPELGQRYLRHSEKHVRVIRYGHYRIAYLLKLDGDVDVLGVFHERMDIKSYLDE